MNTQLDDLLYWYTHLSPDSLWRLRELYAADASFKDPFNDVQGVPAITQLFSHMFANTEHPRFTIVDRMAQGQQAFATWRFTFSLRGVSYEVIGASHFRFTTDGRVVQHRDYWDPAEELWQKMPLISAPVRWLRRRFAAA